MRKFLLTGLVLAAASFAMPRSSFGMAALASGAKTSCKPTAPKGTPLYQSQVNCDPIEVTSFQLTFTYDPRLVMFDPNTPSVGLNFFTIGVSDPVTNPTTGFASVTVRGSTTQPTEGDNEDFGLIFDLIDPENMDTPLPFSVTAVGDDFINAIDTDNDNAPIHRSAAEMIPSSADETMAEIHAVPEPTSIGIFALATTAILARRKRAV